MTRPSSQESAPKMDEIESLPLDGTEPKIFVTAMPFRKNGSPVVGGFGAKAERVVIMTTATWHRLCDEHPTLAATKFNVGTFDD